MTCTSTGDDDDGEEEEGCEEEGVPPASVAPDDAEDEPAGTPWCSRMCRRRASAKAVLPTQGLPQMTTSCRPPIEVEKWGCGGGGGAQAAEEKHNL